jgi:hypothetical protein
LPPQHALTPPPPSAAARGQVTALAFALLAKLLWASRLRGALAKALRNEQVLIVAMFAAAGGLCDNFLNDLNKRFDAIHRRFDELDRRFDVLLDGFTTQVRTLKTLPRGAAK